MPRSAGSAPPDTQCRGPELLLLRTARGLLPGQGLLQAAQTPWGEHAGPVRGCCTSLQIPRVDGEYDLKIPRDMAYVFSGAYIPLSCKIIEQVRPGNSACPQPQLLWGSQGGVLGCGSVPPSIEPNLRPVPKVLERRGWQGLEEVVRLLNGNEFSVSGSAGAGWGAWEQGGTCGWRSHSTVACPDSAGEDNPAGDAQRVILAVFLGGCTFSEIAALRFLGKERGRSCGKGCGPRSQPKPSSSHAGGQ